MILVRPRETLEAFDRFLLDRGLRLDAVILGGAALNLLGVVSRVTKDCDVLAPLLSPELLAAAQRFAEEARQRGEPLLDDWLNNGPASLASLLPPGWEARLQTVFTGTAMELRCLGRDDLLRSW
jgi:hypothetical protein